MGIAIIIILVVIGVIMYGLHYKGKLPQTFYNLGQGGWKSVKTNEEVPVIDDDEKKHPEIVKNGKNWKMGMKLRPLLWKILPKLILNLLKSNSLQKKQLTEMELQTVPEMAQLSNPLLSQLKLKQKLKPQKQRR